MVMKRILILSAVFGALIASSIYFFKSSPESDNTLAIVDQGFTINKYNTPAGQVANEVNWTRPKKENKDERGIKFAALYLSKLRANSDGVYNPMDYYRARKSLEQRNPVTAKRSSSLNLDWEPLGPNNIGGRTRGFLIDGTNPSKLYSGGVTGGLFVSEDMGESWAPHPQTDEWDYMGVSSIKQASNGDIYFGTGEYFVFTEANFSGHVGGGIYKSTDGGTTFQVLPSTIPNPNDDDDDWAFVTEIATDPNNASKIFAARANGTRSNTGTGGGLVYSEDGGQTWQNPTFSPSIGANKDALDVAINENGVVLVCQNRNLFRSTDGGMTFNLQSGQGGFPSESGRIELAFAPQDPNYVYAIMENGASGSSKLRGVYKSTDAGANWEPISPVNSATFNPLGDQGFYDMCITVSSGDKEKVYIGGQLEFYSGKSGGWNLIASSFRSGVVYDYYIHADMHGIYSHPNNPDILFVASDGGMFRSVNATNQFPTFEDANKNYQTTQYYTINADDRGRSIGGLQDNGVQLIDGERNSNWTSEDLPGFGDGGYSAISEVNRNALFGESQNGALKRSSNGGQSFGSFFDEKVDAVENGSNNAGADGLPDVGTEFIAMGYLWEDNPDDITYEIDNPSTEWVDTFVTETRKKSIFFLGANGRLFFTPEAVEFSIQPRWFDIRTSGMVTEVKGTSEGTIFAATGSGNLYQIEGITQKYKYDTLMVERIAQVQVNGNDTAVTVIDKTIRLVPDYPEDNINDWNWNSTALNSHQGVTRTEIGNGLPTTLSYISALAVDPNFSTTGNIVVGYAGYGRPNSNYVYKSSGTGGFSFTDITNDLVTSPVYDALIDADNPDNILLATDLGIFSSNDGGASWTEENNGLYRTPVFGLYQHELYEDGCNVIYAGSYGRGAYRTTTLTSPGCDVIPYKYPVSVEETTVENNIVANLKLYPNPATDKVIVEIENGNLENEAVLTLIDLSGKVIFQERLYDGLVNRKHEVNVSTLSSGYYILNINDGNQLLSQKFMVN